MGCGPDQTSLLNGLIHAAIMLQAGQVWVTLTVLQFPLVYVKARCAVGRVAWATTPIVSHKKWDWTRT